MNLRLKLLIGTAFTCAAIPAYAQDSVPSRDDGGEIVVTGIRKSLQDAIETKKRANSIVDVISAEDVGKLADSNVAESLSRLPGVTVDHQFGEGEQLSIAGVEPALNRLTIDGHSVASADWGGNPSDRSSRSFNYSLLSPTIISQAVVYKTPEARLQEGAIGASVDIVTRKPLDLKPNTVAMTGGGEYNSRAKRGSFRGSALYSWHNADDTIGFLGAVNYDKEQLSRAGSAVYWYRTGDALLDRYPKDANGNIIYGADGRVTSGPTLNGQLPNAAMIAEFSKARVASFLAREFFKQERERIGFSGALQVRPADNLTLTGTALVIRGNYDNLSNSEYTYGYEGSLLQSATYADGMVTSATFAGLPSGSTGATGQLDTNFRRTRVKNDSLTLMLDWKPGDWVVTANFGGTRASGGKDPEYLLDFRTQQGFTSGTNGQSTYVNWQNPASDPSRWLSNYTALGGENQTEAAVRAANGGNPFFGRQIGGITYAEKTRDNELFGQADVSRKVNLGPITEILFGARFASHTNSNTTVGGATFTNRNFTLADLNPYVLDSNLFDGLGVSGNGTPYATLDADAIRATLEKYGTISVSRGLSKDQYFHVKETIASGYVQANFEAGRFRGNVGGRYVFTRDQSQFYVQSGGVFAPTEVTTDDSRFLPAANLIFQAGENVVLRASAAKVMARPRYSDLAGSLSLDDTTRSGSGGNPDLKPYAATNFGLSAEWYFAPASYISGEVFYRDVSNYIGNQVEDGVSLTNTVTGRTLVYSISRPVNGGKAKVTGFSLTANANLFWGFGIQSNYTFTDADTGSPTGLPYLSRDTFTIVPYFEKGPFQARVSFNRRSKYFYRFGRQQSQDYTDGYSQLDASLSYNITDKLQVSASASNLLDETYYQYSSDPKFPTAVYKNGRVYSLSASFRM